LIKPEFGTPIARNVLNKTIQYFEELMVLLHPFMPFITEEIWQNLKERKEGESIMVLKWTEKKISNTVILQQGEIMKELVTGVRNVRNQNNLSPKEALEVKIKTAHQQNYLAFENLVRKLANVSTLEYVSEKMNDAKSFIVKTDEVFIPLEVNAADEAERMTKELEYNKGFLISVDKKLSNERFVQNANPQVIEAERKKKADAEAKIKMLEEGLAAMK